MNNKGHQTAPTDPFVNSIRRQHNFSYGTNYRNLNSPVPVTNQTNSYQTNNNSHKSIKPNLNIETQFQRSKQKQQRQQYRQNQQINIPSQKALYPNIDTDEYKRLTPVFQNINNKPITPPSSTPSPTPIMPTNKKIPTQKIKQKCIICEQLTQKCCSLCRKVFYCTPQHQQFHWHTSHKFQCQGRVRNNAHQENQVHPQVQPVYGTNNTNKFVFYSDNNANQIPPRSNQLYQKQMDYQAIQKFLQLLQQRLVLRSKILNQISKLTQKTPQIVRQSLIKQTQQLLKLSTRITHQQFKPSFSRKITKQDIMQYSSQQWGSQIVISQVGVGLEYYSDLLLMVKIYHLGGMNKEAREIIISIGRLLEEPEQKGLFLSYDGSVEGGSIRKKLNFVSVNSTPPPNANSGFHTGNTSPLQTSRPEDNLSKTKNLLLEAIISLGQAYNIDKTCQSAYKLFIKRIELQQGIWQQIYAYFNMGVWYTHKTYYDKSIKSFLYAQELLDSHKKGTAQSAVFKADCLFNIGIGYWAIGQRILAIQNMQECYRVRMNSIGKNSMESSYCLYHLAKWYKTLQKWNQCLQYLDECHRIRKLYENQPNYQDKIQQIKILIADVHKSIRKQKSKNKQKMDSRTQKYFAQILQQQLQQQQREEFQKRIQQNLLPKGTATSRLFRDDKQYVKFNVIISEELFTKLSIEQTSLLNKLWERIDQRVEKSQAIDMLIESQFVASLDNQQREQFFRDNQVKSNS